MCPEKFWSMSSMLVSYSSFKNVLFPFWRPFYFWEIHNIFILCCSRNTSTQNSSPVPCLKDIPWRDGVPETSSLGRVTKHEAQFLRKDKHFILKFLTLAWYVQTKDLCFNLQIHTTLDQFILKATSLLRILFPQW